MHDRTFSRLCRARDLLREVHDQPLTIRAVAKDAAMSPFHFIRQFEALFGATPHQFRITARLERAKHLLTTSDYSITRICLDVGFASVGTFSDLFARRVGVPPSAYRRRVRSMTSVPRTLPVALTPGCLTLMAAAFAIFEKFDDAAVTDSGHADQTDQHHGGQSGQGPQVLYGHLRLREEA